MTTSFIPRAFRTVSIAMLLAVSSQGCAAGDAQPNDKAAATQAGNDVAGADGKLLYQEHCAACHKPDGKGYVTVIPPLANSDYIAADVNRLVSAAVDGVSGPITVNGIRYEGVMPPLSHVSDAQLAAIFNYIVREWGYQAHEFTSQEIADYRKRAGGGKNRSVQK